MIIHCSKLLIKGKKKDGLFLHSPSPMEKGRYCIAKPRFLSTKSTAIKFRTWLSRWFVNYEAEYW